MRGLSYLAFAAGYRRVSLVLIEDGQIATWHTSKRAARDPENAGRFAREFIDLLSPTVIVMEDITSATRKGAQAQVVLKAIREEAERSRTQLLPLTREKLFRTRYDEAMYLVRFHPELEDRVKDRSFCDREPHQVVLFEALALAHQAAQGGPMLLASNM